MSVTNNAPRTKYNYIRTYVKRRPSSITKRVVCVIVRSFVRRCVRACTPEYSSKNKIMIIGRLLFIVAKVKCIIFYVPHFNVFFF